MRIGCFVFAICLVTAVPASAFAQTNGAGAPDPATAREQAMRARFEARLQHEREARVAAAQQEAAEEKAARQAAQQQEDTAVASLRARLGPGFGTPCGNTSDEPTSPPRSPAYVRGEMVAGTPRDSPEEIATDRATLATFRADFEVLRCYAMHRVVSLPLAVEQELRRKGGVPMPAIYTDTSLIPYRDWIAETIDLESRAKAWAAQRELALVDDETCIATKGCLEARAIQRAAEDVCANLAQRGEVQARIAKERANGRQSGAIDLSLLHELGDQLGSLDDEIAQGKTQYANLAKKAFKPSLCR